MFLGTVDNLSGNFFRNEVRVLQLIGGNDCGCFPYVFFLSIDMVVTGMNTMDMLKMVDYKFGDSIVLQ